MWSVRAAPYVVPTSAAAVFTTGVLPEGEESLRFFISGAGPHLDLFGMNATEVVERTAAALPGILDGRELTKDELGVALAQRLAQDVTPQQLALWNTPDGLRSNRYGETIVRFAINVVALHGAADVGRRGVHLYHTENSLSNRGRGCHARSIQGLHDGGGRVCRIEITLSARMPTQVDVFLALV